MDALFAKYQNCCKFCFKKIQGDPIPLGTKELDEVNLIKQLMGPEIVEENADYGKVLKNEVCFKCASNIILFKNFRKECNDVFKTFKKEFDQARSGKRAASSVKFVCEFCYKYYDSEAILNFHKKHTHKNQLAPLNDDFMDIDVSCGQQSHVSEEDDEIDHNENKISEFYECNDCHRKFLPEDKLIYLDHCKIIHPKKVSCPFGCHVNPTDKNNPVPAKRKVFKNMYFLANHLQKIHFAAVKKEVRA